MGHKDKDKKRQEEIDLVELWHTLWSRRRFILKVTGVVAALGLFFALFGEVKYTAGSVVVPQIGKTTSGGNLQGLAALAGINIGSAEQSDLISPLIYPMVVASVPFQKELMYTPVTVEGHAGQVTLIDYFTVRDYRSFSLFPFLRKYTLGLPVIIMKALRGESAASAESVPGDMVTLTADEYECQEILTRLVTVTVNEKNGYITLTATMPQARMAAEVAVRAQELLQNYITRFKLQKAQANLDFIEARYNEVMADFEAAQNALAAFQDANRYLSSAVARSRETSLENEYDLAFSIYSELARQLEQAEIKVKEDTPVFTVVEPVTVPIRRSAPRRTMILIVSVLAGLLAGAGIVFAKNYLTL